MRTGWPARRVASRSNVARYCVQSTKCGPTSAATSARMIAMLTPSRVACKARSEPLGSISGRSQPRTPTAPDSSRLKAAIICRSSLSRSKCDDFSGIHEVLGIERVFDRAHRVERAAMLGREIFHLALPDPMFASAGAFHCERALDQAFRESLRGRDLGGIVHIE